MTVEGADSGKTLEVTIWAARLTSQGLEVALGPKRQSFLRFVVPVLVGVLLAAVPTGFLWSHLWTALGLTALMGVTHLYFRRQFRRERAKLRRLFLESLGASFPQKSSKHP